MATTLKQTVEQTAVSKFKCIVDVARVSLAVLACVAIVFAAQFANACQASGGAKVKGKKKTHVASTVFELPVVSSPTQHLTKK